MMNSKYMTRYYYTLHDAGLSEVELLELTDKLQEDNELIQLIVKKYKTDWIVYEDVATNPWEEPLEPAVDTTDWQNKFKYIYDSTKDRYKTLITSYNSKRSDLLAKIENTTVSKFNDTPQDSGDFTTSGYTSTVNQTTMTIDPMDAMSRLNLIDRDYKNILRDWVDEFRPIFN